MTKGMIILSVGILGVIGTIIWIVSDSLNKNKRNEQILQKSINSSRTKHPKVERQYKEYRDNVINDKKLEDRAETESINSDNNCTVAIDNQINKTEAVIVPDIQEKTEFIDLEMESTQELEHHSYKQDNNSKNYATESLTGISEAQIESIANSSEVQTESLVNTSEAYTEALISEKTESIGNLTEALNSEGNKTEFL